ncbi:hypothetical protein [Janthinobacterium sp. ZB1P44]|uniref:hypothetical protein n=1 Tax=Janthinobacterium sp. ZB1P44 TaxID=3424192 RepID=UPI003F1F8718
MEKLDTQARMRWFEAGANYVASCGSIVGFIAAVLFGYALEFGWIRCSPVKAFVIGAGIIWMAMFGAMLVAQGISAAIVKE